jgi:hypothetical protein
MKSRRIRWAGHVALIGEERTFYKVLVGKNERKRLLGDRGVDGRMGSEGILWRLVGGVQSGFYWFRIGAGGGLLWVR